MTLKNLILAAALCCLLFSAAPVTADRDVGLQSNYFQRLRDKRANKKKQYLKANNQTKHSRGNDDKAVKMISVRPKKRTRASLLYRSFILAAIFWTIKFVMPQMVRWVSQLCKDISEFKRSSAARAKEMRRHRKKKSQRAEGGTSISPDTVSISPSVMELIDLADSTDDDGSSFISSASTFSSVSTFFGSFASSRRRRSHTSSMAVAPERFTSSAHTTKRPTSRSSKSKTSKSKPSKSSKHQKYMDEGNGNGKVVAPNSLPKYLDFIDEENISSGAAGEKRRNTNDSKQRRSKKDGNYLDDASHVPATGNIVGKHGYKPRSSSRKSGSPLEKKLSAAGSSRDSEMFTNGHSNQTLTQKEKHKSSRSHHHQGQQRHRDRSK